jgi:hypothetical protein
MAPKRESAFESELDDEFTVVFELDGLICGRD